MKRKLKLAYIGGGSKQWARVFMSDLALAENLCGKMALYDIDKEAAMRNKKIGDQIAQNPSAKSVLEYNVYDTLEETLQDATFVILSILPGTFEEMRSDVHTPEKYGIYQSVGDTVGPGGILRAMRTVPLYEEFAQKIKEICPDAWVINFTNPMSICVKTLYDVFPEIKAFGCCHEVFHAQQFLTVVLKKMLGIEANRDEIYTDASGINHFTWITEAKYQDIDLLKLLPGFMDKFYEEGYYEYEERGRFAYKTDPFTYGNKVKMNLFKRYGVLGAAGDRHLAEFMNQNWYLKNPETVKKWLFGLTTVDYRIEDQQRKIKDTIEMAEGRKEFELKKSSEEAIELMKSIMGFESRISNVNLPNIGQVPGLPLGSIVETNCIFSNDCVKPVVSKELPVAVKNLVLRNCLNIDQTYEGIKERDLDKIFAAFVDQPLCCSLSLEDANSLFREMIANTKEYLEPFYNLDW